ncbi:MAG TPA: methyltransferase domain-containing protein [Acidimicrobiales bacterium]|nr:methyltransferase domain-containing protein [Acidimicrobiales bacterium]
MSINFDRIADRYDATRGGDERGARVAEIIAGYLPRDEALVEIGVGTGLVAQAMGSGVIGVDISEAMLDLARPRVPGRLVRADAAALPFRDGAFAGGYGVWVFHLVEDPVAVLVEVRRVLRPGARFVVETAPTHPLGDSPIQAILAPMFEAILRGPRPDVPDRLEEAGVAAGLTIHDVVTRDTSIEETPLDIADSIASRSSSAFWHVTPDQWATHVEPALAALRSLPDPHLPLRRVIVDTTVVLSMS